MAPPLFKASAPGSLILMGEYAVLSGAPAIVMAIHSTITITLTPRTDTTIIIDSALGQYQTTLNSLNITSPFEYVLTMLKYYREKIPSGFSLKIDSEFSHAMGLGSSAAVTAALLKVLNDWLTLSLDNASLWKVGLSVIHQVQGKGSGADLAASLYGGTLVFYSHPFQVRHLTCNFPLHAFFSGEKVSTKIALQKITPTPHWIQEMKLCTEKAIAAIEKNDEIHLGKLLNEGQKLLRNLNVSTASIENIIETVRKAGSMGAKISGSGLGDCVIALGDFPIPASLDYVTTLQVKNALGDPRASLSSYAVAYAPSNIALCKYWGKRDISLNLPMNSSLSISLGNKGATTELSLIQQSQHQIIMNGHLLNLEHAHAKQLHSYLDRFRPNNETAFLVKISVNIPVAAGLASSACIYASIAKALNQLLDWKLDKKALSIVARLGSGSACRSIFEGFVEWQKGSRDNGEDSYAIPLNINWPELCIGLCLVETKEKKVSSRDGMQRTVETSTLYSAWPAQAEKDLMLLKKALQTHDFDLLGKTAEQNALSMHATMLSAWPPLCYSTTETLALMKKVWTLREQGLSVYFTQDAGPNLKLLFEKSNLLTIKEHFKNVEIIEPFNL